MQVYDNVLAMIGNTPLLEFRRLDAGPCRLFGKLELQNPGGSVKDRIALFMVEAAEKDGRLKPGGTLVEATAGNTGLGLALVAGQKGYHLKIVMPDKMSQEKVQHLKALGAEIIMTRSDVGKGHPEYYHDLAERIASETPGSVYISQFTNPANARAHYETTAPEIWEQMGGELDAVVVGVGSGGTLSGIGRFMKEKDPRVEMILADPEGSILAPLVNEGRHVEPGSWLVEGIGEDFVPPVCDIELASKAYPVSDRDAFLMARELLRTEGILAGSSTGVLLTAALRYCREQSEEKRVVVLVADSGNKYLSKMYNDYWMADQGFVRREATGDLRDLITRRHTEHATVTVGPDEPLTTAYKRMRLHDISQLPVLEDGAVVGILDESDLLLAVYGHEESFAGPVRGAMTRRLEIMSPGEPVEALMPVFRKDHVAIVQEQGAFLGLITRVDLLNYLRRKLP
ncbi:MAG: pyridoxal-phosphate dependent enzyme [Gammaproteobacteria bacterium]|jgi:cystathionine beta-synthase|nr:pyridoxal-phosphate dependent enzyme [Gammaproteobacteria bacterium]